jgi:type IV pilus assembly protein PilA
MLAQRRSNDGGGFTLIEVLVVILIVGVLAAIAIPLFAGQTDKAVDAQAKELARTAETTAETIASDHDGEYNNVTVVELHRYEPSIPTVEGTTGPYLSATTHTPTEYSVTVKAGDGDEYTISRNAGGEITRECLSPVIKTGCSGGEKGSW